MNSQLLDYIILALLFILVINLFSRVFYKSHKQESMNQMDRKILPEIQKPYADNVINTTNENLSTISTGSISMAPIIPALKIPATPMIPEKLNTIEFEKQISNSADNKPSKNKFTTEEILQYQDKMFDFNETVNQSSNVIDPVDKINELYTKGNNEMSEIKGKTISEVYDNLTQNLIYSNKKCINKDYLIPPTKENLMDTQSYLISTDSGKYFRHGLLYEGDDVETGSKFFGSVEASDSEYENHMPY